MHFDQLRWKVFNISVRSSVFENMADIQGYCMKCKTYGPIKDGQKIAMANGQERMAGFVHNPGAVENFQDHRLTAPPKEIRIGLIEMSVGLVLPRARGLGL